jgi:hypothetical protein
VNPAARPEGTARAVEVLIMKLLTAALLISLSLFGCASCAHAPGVVDTKGSAATKPPMTIRFPEGADSSDPEQLWVCATLEGQFSCVDMKSFLEEYRRLKGDTDEPTGTTSL